MHQWRIQQRLVEDVGARKLSLTGPLLSPALARRPLAQPGCTEGPSFWCQSLETAVRCGAVQSCTRAGWNLAEDMCADCQQIISILTRMAKESTFKDTIQKFLTHECSTLPFSSLVPHCQKLVDTYFSLFIACLEGQIKTASICTTLGLCPMDSAQDQGPEPLDSQSPEKWILQLLHSLRLDLPDSHTQGGPEDDLPFPLPMCWMCRSFVGRIEATIPKAIGKAMSQLCRFMPGTIGGMCQCLMEKYTITVLDLILDKVGPRLICGMLFLATIAPHRPADLPPAPLLAQSTECQACLTVTSLAKSTLRANSTAAKMEAALLRACSSAPLDWQEVGARPVGNDRVGGRSPRAIGWPGDGMGGVPGKRTEGGGRVYTRGSGRGASPPSGPPSALPLGPSYLCPGVHGGLACRDVLAGLGSPAGGARHAPEIRGH
uniref:Pulmonary surfactant-associated protein B n=1 Tax=Pelusios castaneus TaxID=367368 RepID=A0A8C8VMD1_9SAUR